MVAIVTRAGKGSPLTNAEVDANFVNLNNGKLETSNNLSDLVDASAARTNLGLGSLATQNSITSLQVTTALGYTPANTAGDTFTGDVALLGGRLLIGSTLLSNGKVIIGGALTGQALMSAMRAEVTVMSDVTTGARGYQTLIGTQAASFTLPDIIHYRAVQAAIGAGSTVNSQNAFVADASLIGAGTNIGFRGAIPSGSNRWNLYMDGTASNHIGGSLAIGTTTIGTKVDVSDGTFRNQMRLHRVNGSGDTTMGSLLFAGNNTAGALIDYAVAEGYAVVATAGSEQGAWRISVRNGGTLNEAYRVGPVGQLGIAGANYGTAGQVFASGGSGSAPAWTSQSALSVGTATNIAGGAANQVHYQSAAGTTSFVSAPTTAGTALTWNGTAFTWASAGGSSISNDTTTNATFYPTLSSATSGTFATATVSSTKLTFNPSTGVLAATGFSGPLTGTASNASALAGFTANAYNDRNVRVYSNNSSVEHGILAVSNAGTFVYQIYGTGSNYGFLNGAWAGWDLRKSNNSDLYVTISGTERSVIHSGNIGSQSVSSATYATYINTDSYNMKLHWSGQSGQPTWLWGSNNGADAYVWNPSNFSVNYANSAGNAAKLWVNFNGVSATPAIRASSNVSSLVDYGTGQYGVNFSISLADTNYACVGMNGQNTSGGIRNRMLTESYQFRSASFARFHTGQDATTIIDADAVMFAVYR